MIEQMTLGGTRPRQTTLVEYERRAKGDSTLFAFENAQAGDADDGDAMTDGGTSAASSAESDPDPSLGTAEVIDVADLNVYPTDVQDAEIWTNWTLTVEGQKSPRAPYMTGHGFPSKWSKPEAKTDFETVSKYATMRPYEFEASGIGFPDGEEKSLDIGVILSEDDPYVLVDCDDVRDEETGEVHPRVVELFSEFPTWTEVSSSKSGLHGLYRGTLEGASKIVLELEEDPETGISGAIELYDDHNRFCAMTGYAPDFGQGVIREVADSQAALSELVAESEFDPETDVEEPPEQPAEETGHERDRPAEERFGDSFEDGGDGSMSPYYSVPLTTFARPRANEHESTTGPQGAHPVHGATTHGDRDEDSNNYHIDTSRNVWVCYAHERNSRGKKFSGGGPLTMAAVMAADAGVISGFGCGDCGHSPLDHLTDEQLARVCLYARDHLAGFTEEMTPPYRALVGVARIVGLQVEDGQLAGGDRDVVEQVFAEANHDI